MYQSASINILVHFTISTVFVVYKLIFMFMTFINEYSHVCLSLSDLSPLGYFHDVRFLPLQN